MIYLPYNEEIEKQFKEILVKIRVLMNGVTADLMNQRGANYQKNFGVSFTNLQTIASYYSSSVQLSQRLWQKDMRETKILSILLYPKDKLNIEESVLWVKQCPSIELVEYLCGYLLVYSPYVTEIIYRLSQSNTEKDRIAAYTLAAQYCKKTKPLLNDDFMLLCQFSNISISAKLAQSMLFFLLYAHKQVNYSAIIDEEMKKIIDNECSVMQWLHAEFVALSQN